MSKRIVAIAGAVPPAMYNDNQLMHDVLKHILTYLAMDTRFFIKYFDGIASDTGFEDGHISPPEDEREIWDAAFKKWMCESAGMYDDEPDVTRDKHLATISLEDADGASVTLQMFPICWGKDLVGVRIREFKHD